MKKAVLISIKPEWVAKILNGEKTIEVRKTAPKCELPIEVYIYCTKGQEELYEAFKPLGRKAPYQTKPKNQHLTGGILKEGFHLNGKVVAKFTLRKVEKITKRTIWGELEVYGEHTDFIELDRKSCLKQDEIADYMGRNYHAYAWHIEDLFIFDEPKEINGRAPQSWQYIEVENTEGE